MPRRAAPRFLRFGLLMLTWVAGCGGGNSPGAKDLLVDSADIQADGAPGDARLVDGLGSDLDVAGLDNHDSEPGQDTILDQVGLDGGEVLPDEGYLTPEQQQTYEAWQALRDESLQPVHVLSRNGLPEVMLLDVPALGGKDLVESGLLFLEKHRLIFGLPDPRIDLVQTWAGPESGDTGVAFEVLWNGLPLHAARIGLHIKGDRIRAVSGSYLSPPKVDPLEESPPPSDGATIPGATAMAQALQDLGPDTEPYTEPELVYFAPQVLGMDEAPPRLAWRLRTRNGMGSLQTRIVDAANGDVLLSLTSARELEPHKDFYISTVNEGCSSFCWQGPDYDVKQWYNELGQLWEWVWECELWACGPYRTLVDADDEGDVAYDKLHVVYNYFRDTFDQHGWLNQHLPLPPLARVDMKIHAVFRDDLPMNGGNCAQNAKFIPGCGIAFSTGHVALDVVAHEFTHGLVQTYLPEMAANYVSQPGAINESLADTFAWFLDNGNDTMAEGLPSSSCCAAPGCWGSQNCLPGQTIQNFIRHISNPELCGDPDHMASALSSDVTGFCSGSTVMDDGWVHKNCTILTSSAFRMVRGGTHPQSGISTAGIGLEKGRSLYWRVLKSTWAQPFSFQAFALLLVREAQEMRDEGKLASEDVCSVRNAFAGAGVIESDVDCDGNLDPEGDDQDGDGAKDPQDNCKTRTNPDQADLDDDGHGDACDPDIDADIIYNSVDNCPTVSNMDQKDSNGNGKGDLCEDKDGDGVYDPSDNCLTTYNRSQSDYDGDGKGDACDPDDDNDGIADSGDKCPRKVTEAAGNADPDADGLGNSCDNCPSVLNLGQEDLDLDGVGDMCDPDRDGDLVSNGVDNCLSTPNADQADCDNDGFGMACDPGDVVAPPLPPAGPATQQEFVTGLSFTPLQSPRPFQMPMSYCTTIEKCGELAGRDVSVRVQLGFDSGVRIVNERNEVLAQSSAGLDHQLRFQAPQGLVRVTSSGPKVNSARRLFVEVMRPYLMTEGDARCKTFVTGPFLSAPNLPPVVDAGPDMETGSGFLIHVGSRATDPDSDPLAVVWTQVQGPTVSLEQLAGGAAQLVTPTAKTALVLRVTATDPDGLSASDEITISTLGFPPESNCFNQFDDDFDGLEDCLDQDCLDSPFCACVPDCAFKQCGTDGCGGSCGTCTGGTQCYQTECKFPQCVPVPGAIQVTGLKSDNEGTALWNSNGSGPEPANSGHNLYWTGGSPCYDGTSYYYVASRDAVDSTASSGGHATQVLYGFQATQDALAAGGFQVSDLTYSFGISGMGQDLEGQEWLFDPGTMTELRAYTGGKLTLRLDGQAIIEAPITSLFGTLSYGNLSDCLDDAVSARLVPALLQDISAPFALPIRTVAAALIQDVGIFGISLVFETLEPIGQSSFTSNGRTGAYFENQSGRLEIGASPMLPCP